MPQETTDAMIRHFIKEIRDRLDHAAAVANAAEACIEAGSPAQALIIVLDVEQQIYEANTLLNAASLINSIDRCLISRVGFHSGQLPLQLRPRGAQCNRRRLLSDLPIPNVSSCQRLHDGKIARSLCRPRSKAEPRETFSISLESQPR